MTEKKGSMHRSPAELFGVLAEFETVDALYLACQRLREEGYTRWDEHTPFPVHGLDDAMGIRGSKLPWLVLFIFCPLYALGAHTAVFKAIFYGVPGARFLRAPSIIMFMFSCASAVLASFFVDSLLGKKTEQLQKKIGTGLIAFVVVMAVMLTAGRGVFLGMWKGIFGEAAIQKMSTVAEAGSGTGVDVALLLVFGIIGVMVVQTAHGCALKACQHPTFMRAV